MLGTSRARGVGEILFRSSRCPETVKRSENDRPADANEPPAVTLLPDGRAWLDFYSGLYDLYRRSGTTPAQQRFNERNLTPVGPGGPSATATQWHAHSG